MSSEKFEGAHDSHEKGSPPLGYKDSGAYGKTIAPGYVVSTVLGEGDDRYNFSATETELLQRKLKQRHVQM